MREKKKGKNRQFSSSFIWEKHMSGSAHYEGLRRKRNWFPVTSFWKQMDVRQDTACFSGKKGFFYLVPKIRTAPLPLFIMTWKKGTGAINQVAWLGWGGIDLISFHSPPFPFLRTREPGQQSGFFSQDVYMRESKVPVHIFFL